MNITNISSHDEKDNLLEKKNVVDGELVKTVNNDYKEENIPINHRDLNRHGHGDQLIDGDNGGSSPCYKLPAYDTMEECQQNWDYGYCVEHCYEGVTYDEDSPDGVDLSPTSGVSIVCIGSSAIIGGTSLFACLGFKGAIAACIKAGVEAGAAVAPCL